MILYRAPRTMSPLFILALTAALQSSGEVRFGPAEAVLESRGSLHFGPAEAVPERRGSLHSQPDTVVLLSSEHGVYVLDSYLEVLVDTAGSWHFADVSRKPLSTRFRWLNGVNVGYSSAAYWVRFSVRTATADMGPWLLELAEKSLDHVQVYAVPPSAGYPHSTGDAHPFGTRSLRHRNFLFRLPAGAQPRQDIYLRVSSRGPISFPLRIWSTERFLQKDREQQLFLGVFFGILLIMGIYNLVLYSAVRHRSYLLYALFIFSFLLYQISVERIGFEYFWPDNLWWMERANSFLALLCAALSFLFTRSFLETWRFAPRLDRLLTVFAVLSAPMMAFVLFGPRAVVNEIVVYFVVISVTVLLLSAVVCFRRGDRAAVYYLSGWLFLLAGVFIGMIGFLGWVPRDPFGQRSVQIGAALGITLLSQIGLGYRYDQLRKARERMRLRIATDLHDEIGSGLTQISLYSELVGREAQGRTAQLAEETGELARVLAGKMQDIVWAVKPGREGFEGLELRMKDFATRLLTPQGLAFDMEGRVPSAHLPLRVELRQNLVLIFKEIIHNAVRHARCTRITVRYGMVRDTLWFRICDDGCGFDPEAVRKNNGLRNLEYRADEIGGTLTLQTKPGGPTCYRIEAPLFVKTTGTGRFDFA